ncbi:hypothetical protein MKW92_016894 [Papaver armeniacum]|nr:hypothetical protein MKW92_016894 [Papaver armeniacum]
MLRVLVYQFRKELHLWSRSTSRDVMQQVLDDWKARDEEEKCKALHDYLEDVYTSYDVYTNYGLCESMEDFITELRILKRLDCVLDADEHEYLLAFYSANIQLCRAEKKLFKVKVAMLDFCKSRMKAATLLDFVKSLAALPEEFSASPLKDATMLDFFKSLVNLDLPEERKNWLLQQLVESKITSAYNDAKKSLKESQEGEKFFIDSLQKLGVKYQEDDSTDDEYPCTDMDSFKKRLEVMEVEVEEKLEIVRRVDESRNLDFHAYADEVKFYIRHLDERVNQCVRQAEK